MKKLFYLGTFLGSLAIVSIIPLSAQFIEDIDITPEGKPISYLTKADRYYTATSTAVSFLSETELIQVKEQYNNTDRIVTELKEIKNLLYKIEKHTR